MSRAFVHFQAKQKANQEALLTGQATAKPSKTVKKYKYTPMEHLACFESCRHIGCDRPCMHNHDGVHDKHVCSRHNHELKEMSQQSVAQNARGYKRLFQQLIKLINSNAPIAGFITGKIIFKNI